MYIPRHDLTFGTVGIITKDKVIYYYEIVDIKIEGILTSAPRIKILARGFMSEGIEIFYNEETVQVFEKDLNYLIESVMED